MVELVDTKPDFIQDKRNIVGSSPASITNTKQIYYGMVRLSKRIS